VGKKISPAPWKRRLPGEKGFFGKMEGRPHPSSLLKGPDNPSGKPPSKNGD